MKHTILFLLLPLFAASQKTTHKVQDFILVGERWQRSGSIYAAPDTLTIIHGYKWKRERIVAVQDYKKQGTKWVKYGEVYAMPDSVRKVRGFVR